MIKKADLAREILPKLQRHVAAQANDFPPHEQEEIVQDVMERLLSKLAGVRNPTGMAVRIANGKIRNARVKRARRSSSDRQRAAEANQDALVRVSRPLTSEAAVSFATIKDCRIATEAHCMAVLFELKPFLITSDFWDVLPKLVEKHRYTISSRPHEREAAQRLLAALERMASLSGSPNAWVEKSAIEAKRFLDELHRSLELASLRHSMNDRPWLIFFFDIEDPLKIGRALTDSELACVVRLCGRGLPPRKKNGRVESVQELMRREAQFVNKERKRYGLLSKRAEKSPLLGQVSR